MHTHLSKQGFPHALQRKRLAALMSVVLSLGFLAESVHASSWNPTLLVNTEAFQIIHEGDSAAGTDIELRFGDTVNEKLYWNRATAEFHFSDDIRADGNITGSGTLTVSGDAKTKADLTINSDNGAANAVLTFGNATTAQTLTYLNTAQKFSFSKDARILGNLSGSSLNVDGYTGLYGALTVSGATKLKSTLSGASTITFSNLKSCDTIDTNSVGVLACGSDDGAGGGITQATADARYVNQSGDTMTGALTVRSLTGGNDQTLLAVSGGTIVARDITPNNDIPLLVASGGGLRVSGNASFSGTILSVGQIKTRGNLSGATLNVNGMIATSGSLVANTASRIKANLNVAGILSGATLNIMSGANSYIRANLGIGTATPKTKLEVMGSMSGASLTTYNLNTSKSATTGSLLVSTTANGPKWAQPLTSMVWFIDGALQVGQTGSAVITMPFGLTVTTGSLRTNVAPTGAAVIVDIERAGVSIFSTRPQIAASAKTSAKSGNFAFTHLSGGNVVNVAVDQIGSTIAGSGLTIMLTGRRHY